MFGKNLFAFPCFIVSMVVGHLAFAETTCPGPRDQRIRPKIVRGWAADLRHWPGQVALRIHNEKLRESGYFCGGTLIAGRWVLSAAHCFQRGDVGRRIEYFPKDASGRRTTLMSHWRLDASPHNFSGVAELQVVIGVDDLRSVTEEHIRRVRRIIVHPKYVDATRSGHDIALVELARPWRGPTARLSVDPATDPNYPPGAMTMVAGFGDQKWQAPLKLFQTREGHRLGAGSEVLREVDLPTVATPVCQQHLKSQVAEAVVGKGQICAGYVQGRKDSCQGDSGGPLVAFDKTGCPYQVGIVSWGLDCAADPAYGVYTRVSAYAGWIRRYVPKLSTVSGDDFAAMGDHDRGRNQAELSIKEITRLLGPSRGKVSLAIKSRRSSAVPTLERIKLDERFIFEATSMIDGRLIIIDVNAAGVVTQIFPNKFVSAENIGRIRAGETLRIPVRAYGFDWFRATEPVGDGKLVALVVPEEFASKYQVATGQWRAKGFAPERSQSSFFANLIDQIYGLLGTRSGSKLDMASKWDITTVSYKIVK